MSASAVCQQQTPRLIVFDLDGTIIDSRLDLANAVNSVLTQLGRHSLPEPQIASYIGDGAGMLVRRSLEATGTCDNALLPKAMPLFFRAYRHHETENTYIYDGVLQVLQQMKTRAPETLLAVLTNKPVRPSRRICQALGLASFFFANYGGDSFATKKPSPEGLLHLIAEASGRLTVPVTPDQTVMVGDSDVDVRTARAASVCCIGCAWGFARDALLAAKPDYVANSPSEWMALLLP